MDPLEHRVDYELATLDDDALGDDPIAAAQAWLLAAAGQPEPNAMVLSTVGADGAPTSRTVLLRGLSPRGLEFFTNRDSRKGRAIAANAQVAAVFGWLAMQRQLIVLGRAEPLTPQEDDAYFASRPWRSQVAAVASRQSHPIGSRAELEAAMARQGAAHPDGTPVPRPAHWGGYRIVPRELEFWQGRRSRLHDRIVFARDADDAPWRRFRRQP